MARTINVPWAKEAKLLEETTGETNRGWLDKDGICKFPGAIQRMPNGVWMAGKIDIMELVTGIVWNKPGPGFEVFEWDVSAGKPPQNIIDRTIGLQLDIATIDYIQQKYGGKGILLGESDGDIQDKGITPTQWMKKYKSNGLAALIEQRFNRYMNKM